MNKTTKIGIVAAMMVLVLSISAYAMGPGRAAPSPTIVDTALAVNAETGEFSILIAALTAADESIIKSLSSRGQYTVFAPTDAAFVAMLEDLELEAAEVLSNQELLNTVLTYHVARGNRDAADVTSSTQIRTLQGSFVGVDGAVLTDELGREANIVAVDIFASNGVIHVIDAVILPDEAVALI